MRGLTFQIENTYDIYLDKILKNIDDSSYLWKIDEDEVLSINSHDFFEKDFYPNNEFKNKISQTNYLIFANIKLYKNKIDTYQINTYTDFMNSNCLMIILVTDNVFVDIYCKDKKILETIVQNLEQNQIPIIKIIDKENDTRKVMSAYLD